MTSTINLPSTDVNTDKTVVVETYELSKIYLTGFWLNKKIPSLKNCTLKVYQGETFGLLGPNGAGKTTLLKTLLGIIKPTSGKAKLLGKPLGDNSVKQRLGYLPENAYYYDFLTAWEFLHFIASLFQIPKHHQNKRILELLDLVGLAKQTAQKKQLRQYSKGMMQRVGMAQALINDPEIVFFDEPMSGLDPMGRYQVRQIILSLKEQGKTIFFNSHVLADVEKICDRIAILARGELLNIGSLDEILGTQETYHATIRNCEITDMEGWLSNISQENHICRGELRGNPQEFINYLAATNAELVSLNLVRDSLEDYFIRQLEEKGITSSQ
ncbi:ABC transporter ATP-binding protein [Cyanobacterium stanieri LEGE 03274]|uniref:ABC transporter ATP-binding protein n=1 Tax=Cyanobacterium stanieri LEGE 03274 TaxID=1828756 RepID=A0ABR9UZX1_9CHRO|nr:ABC transporter ATP-binding protein [Cyanobacterium stanieri]MBE9221188.1 ABC transporter ATP-binding protein [Cyanobacterium stanieri LEGE 03274]